MSRRAFRKPILAKRLGFKSSKDAPFRRFLKEAIRQGLVKIEQSGFLADSMHHHKIVVLLKIDMISLIERTAGIPSWQRGEPINGYRLVMRRTGFKRILKTGEYSNHEWWVCEDCGRKIGIGEPYAAKAFPILCKCIPCYLNMLEEWDIYNL